MVGDLARYLFWVHLREVVDPEDTAFQRLLSRAVSKVQHTAGRPQRRVMLQELRACFPEIARSERTALNVVRSAYDLQVQCLVEELLLAKLTAADVTRFMRFDGREHLDDALAAGRGALLVFPHAGNVMLLIALLGLSGYDFTQVAARGFPPEEKRMYADHQPTWLNRRARTARDRAEDALPAQFLTIDSPPRELVRTLERGGILGVAFDGRGGARFRPTRWLDRTALLSTGPWRLAAMANAPVVPALCIRGRDRRHRLRLCPAQHPDPALGRRDAAEELQERVLRNHLEPLLRRHPDHYGRWLLHCRLRAGMDDHPLFVDTAPDARWRVHEHAGF